MIDGVNELSSYECSEGALYLLFIIGAITHPEGPAVFAIDNIDSALNPLLTTKMLSTLIKATCDEKFKEDGLGPDQVFLTSHNPTALDAFDIFDDDQQIFVVMRDATTGNTQAKRLKPEPRWTKADWIKANAGKSLSELWIEGKIKGALGL